MTPDHLRPRRTPTAPVPRSAVAAQRRPPLADDLPMRSPRSAQGQFALLRRQLEGVDAWNARRRQQEEAARIGQRSREQRLDLTRRMAVLREQHRALVARTEEQLQASVDVLDGARTRAVVVHRNEWFLEKVTAAFLSGGVDVVARLSNGAQAVGVVVAEQPDLLLVEDALPMLPGDAVVREVRQYAPATLIGAQVAHDAGVAPMLAAGASAAYVRRVPPAEVAAALVELLQRSSA